MKIVEKKKINEAKKLNFSDAQKLYSVLEKSNEYSTEAIVSAAFGVAAEYLSDNGVDLKEMFQYMKKYIIELEKLYKQTAKNSGYDAW